ncbi:hypothetical protein PVAND_001183 [Polypedilum vanderplanki]|uniref:Golgin subfamily A conserved domain-containing protein n=1 Tax=Polypedilum vanderplanki TaxID=319348 RepID=A0A9J6BMF6_POLVA|nr:hypothetical protein PVAND_001183 [Polypedilum vanderplanki]
MDKAEKIKAARKKLKEFQSHKNCSSINDNHEEPQQQNIEEPITNQQQNADTNQTISNYFDSSPANFILPISTQDSLQSQQQIINDIPQQQAPIDIQNNIPNQEMYQMPIQQHAPQTLPMQHFSNESLASRMFSPPNLIEDNKLKELQDLINSQNIQITQLRSEIQFYATNSQKNTEELNRLKEQEKSHNDVVKILVTEKSNLNDLLQKTEFSVQQLKNENEELHNRLNVSRHRVKNLESQIQTSIPQTQSSNQPEIDPKKLEEMVNERVKQLHEINQKLEAEKNEMKLLLNQHRIELENLQKNFDHVSTEYHLATIKIAQLTEENTTNNNASNETPDPHQSKITVLQQEVAIKQQQINELNSIIDQLNNDRDSSETQYQNYVSAMTTELQELKESTSQLSIENNKLAKREQELLKQIFELERQMQQQIQKQKVYAEQNQEQTINGANNNEEINKLTSQLTAITEANESLKGQLSQIESEKLELSKKLNEKMEEIQGLEFQLEKMKTVTPNLNQLMLDFEDKSTAASRALSQNQSLKDQLDELQRAFVIISNDKMELTDKLQSEIHLFKELKIRYDAIETELAGIKEKWHYKEDEMIRLSKENTELEKKIFQQNIEIDRLRHYESKDYHGTEGILEKELENSKRMIETLTNKINLLESTSHKCEEDHHHHHSDESHHHHHSHEHNHSHSHENIDHSHSHDSCHEKSNQSHLLEEIEMLKMEKNELIKAINDFQMSKKTENKQESTPAENDEATEEMNEEKMQLMSAPKSVAASMATEEALEKLQGRFRRTMLEVAELTEEKQRLEHVVTQLQFETETIGEYITLYQNQRRLLKQKEHERDIQLKNLASDRELMQKKLVQLNSLIEKFLIQHTDHHTEVTKEATKIIESEKENFNEPIISSLVNNHEMNLEQLKKDTAEKILEILSDIKTTNTRSYDSNIGVEKSCACCYGELKTV